MPSLPLQLFSFGLAIGGVGVVPPHPIYNLWFMHLKTAVRNTNFACNLKHVDRLYGK